MHVFESQYNLIALKCIREGERAYLGCVEEHLQLGEDAVLTQMVVEIAAVHQVQDETQLVRRLKGIRHTDDEGTVLLEWPL